MCLGLERYKSADCTSMRVGIQIPAPYKSHCTNPQSQLCRGGHRRTSGTELTTAKEKTSYLQAQWDTLSQRNKAEWQRTPQLPLASLQSQWCWCRSWCRNWASHYTVHGHSLLRSFSHQHSPFRLPPSLGYSHLSVRCHLFMHRLLVLNVLLSWVVSL